MPTTAQPTIARATPLDLLEQCFELSDCHAGVPHDRRHRVSADRIIARNDDSNPAFRHEDVFALSVDSKTGLFERFDSRAGD